ncbi:MAG: hypothetical protein H0U49_03875, partial [Parachlamydiaceae bacterium]|nr:hypothetical protein [Parachlamydiaceae bacterium]
MKNNTEEELDSSAHDSSYDEVSLGDLINPLAELQEEHLDHPDQSGHYQGSPYYTAVSLEMLNEFKQLLIAFKYRQDEEKATAQYRIKMARELKLAHAKISELTKTQDDTDTSAELTDLCDSLFFEELTSDDKQQEINAFIAKQQSELQMAKEENFSLQQQIQISKKLAVNLQEELKTAREGQKHTPSFNDRDSELQDQSLKESRLHAEQLERAIHILREKSEESNLEKAQLQRELLAYQNAYNLLEKRIEEVKAGEEELKQKLDKEIADKTAAHDASQSIQQQCEVLKDQLHKLQQSLDQQESGLNETLKSQQNLSDDREQLATALKEKSISFDSLVNEVAIIKQTLVSGLREARELESHYLAAVKEKVDAVSQFSQLQRATDKQRIEIEKSKSQCKELMAAAQAEREEFNRQYFGQQNVLAELKMALSASEDDNKNLRIQNIDLESKITTAFGEIKESQFARQRIEDELHKCEKFAQEKEIMSNELLDRLVRVEEEKNHAYEDLDMCHRALEEKEQLFDEAQQHLAKKVRETSQLDSRIEELNAQAKASLSSYELIENHSSELKARLQKSLDLQVHLEEKIHAHIKDIELWKEKHADIELKWQTAKKQIEDLQKISDRHQQLQNMVSNFGNILGMPLE